MGFSRKEYWSGLPRPPPRDLPNPGIEPASLTYPALAGRFFTTSATWEAPHLSKDCGLSRCKTSHCPRSSPSQSSEEGLLDSSPLQRTVSLNPPNSSKICCYFFHVIDKVKEESDRTGSILKAGLHLGPDCRLWALCLVSMETTYQLENQAPRWKSPRACT